MVAWPAVVSNELSPCHHCHPVDGALDPRDLLVRTISPNILVGIDKEVEKSTIELQKPSITSSVYHWCSAVSLQTGLQPRKLILGVLSDLSRKLAVPTI